MWPFLNGMGQSAQALVLCIFTARCRHSAAYHANLHLQAVSGASQFEIHWHFETCVRLVSSHKESPVFLSPEFIPVSEPSSSPFGSRPGGLEDPNTGRDLLSSTFMLCLQWSGYQALLRQGRTAEVSEFEDVQLSPGKPLVEDRGCDSPEFQLLKSVGPIGGLCEAEGQEMVTFSHLPLPP